MTTHHLGIHAEPGLRAAAATAARLQVLQRLDRLRERHGAPPVQQIEVDAVERDVIDDRLRTFRNREHHIGLGVGVAEFHAWRDDDCIESAVAIFLIELVAIGRDLNVRERTSR